MADQEENIMTAEMQEEQLVQDLIQRFQADGIDAYNAEDFALGLTTPLFQKLFLETTGIDFKVRFERYALNTIDQAQMSITWLTQEQTENYKTFLDLVQKADIHKIKNFIKSQHDLTYIHAVNDQKQSALHIAVKKGHATLASFLIKKGFNPEARDKQLKTPLHYACLGGHDLVFEALMQRNPQLLARDKNGATIFHYACASSSENLVRKLLTLNPNFILEKDKDGRTGLFYVIWNDSSEQIKILRLLTEHKADINIQDINLRTPLHHASIGGKARVIPFLCQKGAKLKLRDKDNKYPMDLALNQKIKETLVVYGKQAQEKSDIRDIGARRENQMFQSQLQKNQSVQIEKKDSKPQLQTEHLKNKPNDPQKSSSHQNIQGFLRDNFYQIMKDIQNQGIEMNEHIKRPYMYSGSWMEGIMTIDDLLHAVKDIQNPCEALMRAFNILCPYQDKLPAAQESFKTVSQFYGSQNEWFSIKKPENILNDNKNFANKQDLQTQELLADLEESKKLLDYQRNQNVDLQLENDQLKQQLEEMTKNRDLAQERLEEQEQELNQRQQIIDDLNEKKSDFELQVADQKDQIDNLTAEAQTAVDIKEYEKVVFEKDTLQKAFDDYISAQIQKTQKNGIVFLKALQNQQNMIVHQEPQLYLMSDDHSIIKMLQKLKNNPPSLKQRLKQVNKDRSGKIKQDEMIQFLRNLNLENIDIEALLRIFGYFNGEESLKVEKIISILDSRPQKREIEEARIFQKLIGQIRSAGIESDVQFIQNRFYQYLNLNEEEILSPENFRECFQEMNFSFHPREFSNLMDILDSERVGSISFDYFKEVFSKYFLEKDIKLKNVLDEHVQDLDEFQLINGDLKLQIPFIQLEEYMQLPQKVFIRIVLEGTQEITKWVEYSEELRYSAHIIIQNVSLRSLSSVVQVEFFKDEGENLLGSLQIEWKNCINNQNKWYINSFFDLFYVDQLIGKVAIQMKYQTLEQVEMQKTKFYLPNSSHGKFVLTIVKAQINFEVEDLLLKIIFQGQEIDTTSSPIEYSQVYWENNKFTYDIDYPEKVTFLFQSYQPMIKIILKSQGESLTSFWMNPCQAFYNPDHNLIFPQNFKVDGSANKLFFNFLYIL